jgi:phosphate transport system permease protein
MAVKRIEVRARKQIDIAGAVVYGLTGVASLSIIALIIGIFYTLFAQSTLAMERFGFFGFLFSTDWDPVRELFGGATALFGTVLITFLAMVMAVPVAIGIAVFITELCPKGLRGAVGAAIELLAAIPSIVYGMWGLFTLTPIMAEYVEPFLQATLGRLPVFNILLAGTPLGIDILTASMILAIMIIPFTASISRDAFNLTPPVVKESAYGLGATKWEVIRNVVLPHSKISVLGGIILSLGRAVGETMAVAFVLGGEHKITWSLLDMVSTITVTLANEFTEADTDIYLSSLYLLALILFIFSFIMLAGARLFVMRSEKRA